MADSLVVSDASQALVLADAARGAAERSLVLYDDSDNKRKAKSVGGVPKKGKRFGLPEDKPFRPLPYVELPVGLSEVEVDQFLREQRLEDLNRKLQLQQLEDVEPDIRPPSPPPLYDRQGNRLNTREVRIRKAMLAEFNRLIRYMLKNLENYVPPEGWKPQRLVKKIIIPYEKYPTASFMGVIIGARGVNHKRLQEASGCRIFIRGKDIGDKWQTDEELHMPQHVHIEGDTEEQIETATNLIMPLLNPESPEFEYARTHGMQQVAVVNGFTLKKSEHRCGVCGALGHLGFDCPESEAYSYKMANVKCDICGDRGHVASDCKQAAEQHKKENVDWKEEAEKKRELDAEYERMMSELGLSTGKKKPPAPPAPPGTAPETPLPEAAPETPAPEAAPETPAPVASPGNLQGAEAAAALMASRAKASGPGPPSPTEGTPVDADKASQPLPRPPDPPPPPVPPPPKAEHGSAPCFGGSAPSTALALPEVSKNGVWPPVRPRQPLRPRPRAQWAGKGPPYRPPGPAVRPRHGDGVTIACPRVLAQQLWQGPHVLREMSQETGAHVSVNDCADGDGGPYFLLAGPPEAREMAKMHVRAWLDVNSRPWLPGGPPSPPQSSFQPSAPWTDASFPPGFPPFPGLPTGLPPAGFPPGFAPPPFQAPASPGFSMDPPLEMLKQAMGPPSPPPRMSAEAYDEI